MIPKSVGLVTASKSREAHTKRKQLYLAAEFTYEGKAVEIDIEKYSLVSKTINESIKRADKMGFQSEAK